MRCSVSGLQVIRLRRILKTSMKVQFIYFAIVTSAVRDLELLTAQGYQTHVLCSLCIIVGGLSPYYFSHNVLFLESKSQHKT